MQKLQECLKISLYIFSKSSKNEDPHFDIHLSLTHTFKESWSQVPQQNYPYHIFQQEEHTAM